MKTIRFVVSVIFIITLSADLVVALPGAGGNNAGPSSNKPFIAPPHPIYVEKAKKEIEGFLRKLNKAGLMKNVTWRDKNHVTFDYNDYSEGHICWLDSQKKMDEEIAEIVVLNEDKNNRYRLFRSKNSILLVLPPGVQEEDATKFWKILEGGK